MKLTGLILIVFGLVAAVFTSFGFFTREKVVDVGSIEITADKRHDVQWSPILGLAAAALGAGLYFAGSRRANQ